ncbi:uncharacterized protein LOC114274110 [Camellia sinensis]|uniref:uncharacterized protein LOC114274110 n=1 Tax=Camellia sinensis TaxID=4442 RepID=UPI001036B149|nr:uncharacterized protein LOC114274110 [Camellia sinensis]
MASKGKGEEEEANEFRIYDGKGTLEEGETAEARFIKIQAAYELLMDVEKRRQYDIDNRVNPMKASQAWMEWLMKKRKAFDQRGDMVVAAWAAQQQREMNLRVRHLSRSKVTNSRRDVLQCSHYMPIVRPEGKALPCVLIQWMQGRCQ